jgi:hypothetical protein
MQPCASSERATWTATDTAIWTPGITTTGVLERGYGTVFLAVRPPAGCGLKAPGTVGFAPLGPASRRAVGAILNWAAVCQLA